MKKRLFVICVFCLFGSFLQANTSEEIYFKNGDITLAGTLLMPEGKKSFPAVVFIHGSGQETSDNYLKEAEKWVEQGYAALAYDKRGVGKSQGDANAWNYFSFEDLAGDAAAAVQFLSERLEIDKQKIGFFAASQGGWVAPLAAVKSGKVAFMVIQSASVSTVSEDRIFERAARLKAEGFNDAEIAEVREMHLLDEDVSRGKYAFEKFAQLWEQHKNKRWLSRYDGRREPMEAEHAYRQWYRSVMDFEPQQYLEQLSIPVLWLYGDAAVDRFCPVELSIQRLEQMKAKNRDYHILSFPEADHSLVIHKKKRAPFKKPMFEWLASKGL